MDQVGSTDERELKRRLVAMAKALDSLSALYESHKDSGRELENAISNMHYDQERINTLFFKIWKETK